MDPVTAMALATSAVTLLEKLIPEIERLAKKGEITVEQQKELRAKYTALKERSEAMFTGSEWTVE